MRRLLFVVNDAHFFVSHRLPIAQEAKRLGFDVHVATSSKEGDLPSEIYAAGFHHHFLPLNRSGLNPFIEIISFISLWLLLMRLRPSILHLVTIKPVIYGGLAARFAPVKGVVAAVSGLGFVFLKRGMKANLIRAVVVLLYRLALKKKDLKVIFQNSDDCEKLVSLNIISYSKTILIRGSGVDLSLCYPQPEAAGTPVVTFAARLLRDKGVEHFVDAARILRQRGVNARFLLAGDIDPGNPSSISHDDIFQWRTEQIVEWIGYSHDICQVFAESHVVVLPSYREGLPKVLVEAAACGRAIVTTDVPGCRDAIDSNVTGLLVPARDVVALSDAIQQLVEYPELRRRFGRAGRALAEREFSIESIVQQHMNIYLTLEKTV